MTDWEFYKMEVSNKKKKRGLLGDGEAEGRRNSPEWTEEEKRT
jgi:hypothetical protein